MALFSISTNSWVQISSSGPIVLQMRYGVIEITSSSSAPQTSDVGVKYSSENVHDIRMTGPLWARALGGTAAAVVQPGII